MVRHHTVKNREPRLYRIMKPIEIDGAMGEGGGHIVRTALALSCITGDPIRIRNVRQGRRIPGLRPQHVAAARILQRMCNGEMRCGVVGSETLEFWPGTMQDSMITTNVGTAGSIPLVLQAAIPAAWAMKVSLDLTVTGGTDVRWAPTADYTRLVMGNAYASMGADISIDVLKRGYYPQGGGCIRARIGRGSLKAADFIAAPSGDITICCSLWRTEAAGEARAIADGLHNAGHTSLKVTHEEALGPGASILLYRSGRGFVVGADSLYRNGYGLVAQRLLESSSVDDNLADMLVVPASIAAGLSVFEVAHITKHLETALQVASYMTGCRYGVTKTAGGYQVKIRGTGQV